MDPNFIPNKLTKNNLDNYYIRTSIFKCIQNHMHLFSGKLLDSGCGKMPYKDYILSNSKTKEYIGIDIENSLEYDVEIKPDVTWDGVTMPFADHTFDCILSTEVLEHCYDFKRYIQENMRVLKPGGYFFFTVPYLWPLHEIPHDNFRYTPYALSKAFNEFNENKVEIFALGGWNSSLATMLGLWVNRYISKKKAKLLKPLFLLIIKRLIKKDKPPKTFGDNTMITGLYGYVKKDG